MINNGHISNFFNLERGCRQDDPLSPYLFIYLFIIGVELLSLQIKSNPKIKGAWVNDTAGFTTLAKNRETSYVSMIAVFKT